MNFVKKEEREREMEEEEYSENEYTTQSIL